jgi:hypothetical protein
MPKKVIDLAGLKVGRLTAIEFSHIKRTPSGAGQYFWKCICDCGKEVFVDGCCLRRKSTTSCGCYIRELTTKHGGQKIGSPTLGEYAVWCSIKSRCLNPKNKSFKYYGGRGIEICDEWKNSFSSFLSHVGCRPTKIHTIDRINNSLGYQPGNVRWATRSEQNENTRQTRLISHNETTQSLGKWSKKIGLTRSCIRRRLDKLGMTVSDALDPSPIPKGPGGIRKRADRLAGRRRG